VGTLHLADWLSVLQEEQAEVQKTKILLWIRKEGYIDFIALLFPIPKPNVLE
jgi:hypothetical protein